MIKPITSFPQNACKNSPIDENSLRIAQDLCDTLSFNWEEGRSCCSLSANQIGENQQILVVSAHIGGEIRALFNPKIIQFKQEMDFWEDNMCRPRMLYKNLRAFEICVKFQDEGAHWQSVWLSGKLAGIIQQEIDNLNGILPELRAVASVECGIKSKKQHFER